MQQQMNVTTTLSKPPSMYGGAWPSEFERELVDEAKNGSADAFEQLVARYNKKVFRIAYNITHHYHDAEDVVQSAFLKAFNKLSLFRGDSSFYTWLVSITVNEALMRMRRHRPKEVLIDESRELGDIAVADVIHALGPNPEQSCSHSELRRILAVAINKLKPELRVVFQLRDVEGFSTHETAEALNLTLPAVKTRLLRARMTLRRSLHKLFRPQKTTMPAWQQPEPFTEEILAAFGPLRN
jgi:RNA polymerase sigma-70 factor, ECF subfamily